MCCNVFRVGWLHEACWPQGAGNDNPAAAGTGVFETIDLEEENREGQALGQAFHVLDTPGMQLGGLRSSPAQLPTSSPSTVRREQQPGSEVQVVLPRADTVPAAAGTPVATGTSRRRVPAAARPALGRRIAQPSLSARGTSGCFGSWPRRHITATATPWTAAAWRMPSIRGAADQRFAVFSDERQPLRLRDSLRHSAAPRLKASRVRCLGATDANAASRVSASWMHTARLRISGPCRLQTTASSLCASDVLAAALGSTSTCHFADGSPAQQHGRCSAAAGSTCAGLSRCVSSRSYAAFAARDRQGRTSGRQRQRRAASLQQMSPQHAPPKPHQHQHGCPAQCNACDQPHTARSCGS